MFTNIILKVLRMFQSIGIFRNSAKIRQSLQVLLIGFNGRFNETLGNSSNNFCTRLEKILKKKCAELF